MHEFTPKTYYYKDIKAKEELWKWEAIYNDQTTLAQFDDEDNQFHKLLEIDQQKLKILRIYSSYYPNTYTIIFPEEPFRLIVRHHRIRLKIGTLEDSGLFTIFIFGFELDGKRKQFLVVHENEGILTDDYDKIKV